MDGPSYVKVPLRSSAILNIQNDDKYCFLWCIYWQNYILVKIILI